MLGAVIVVLVVMAGFVVWGYTPPAPMAEALSALVSDSKVNVTLGNWLVFTPIGTQPDVGFIIYPGGRVDSRSYSPSAHETASRGYLVVIVPMPLNLAVFAPDSALDVVKSFPAIRAWAVGGHSLGGSMAAQFAAGHQDKVQGLVLWASYPPSGNDLSKSKIKVVSIHGTLDGLVLQKDMDSSRSLLPPNAIFVSIPGGNHAQFGWYGPQSGDNAATISREEQQNITVAATIALLDEI